MTRRRSLVKGTRRYDVSRRSALAEQNRSGIVAAARDRFLRDGFVATTVVAIAQDAGVSPESVYKHFGGKPGLLRAIRDDALAGSGPRPAESRSDALSAQAESAGVVIDGWATLMREVMPRVAPILLLVRDAAACDADAASLHGELEAARRQRMQHNARRLRAMGDVRPELSLADTTDVLWLYSAPEWYERLVLRRRWSVRRYARFIGEAMRAALARTPPVR